MQQLETERPKIEAEGRKRGWDSRESTQGGLSLDYNVVNFEPRKPVYLIKS